MPGRDYNRAYAAFEQSLGDTTYPTASVGSFEWSRHKSQKRANPVSQSVRVSSNNTPQGGLYKWRKDDRPQARRHSAGVSAFPPTPPPNVALDEALVNPSNGELYAHPPYRPRLSTPTTTWSIPTPDTTPPSLVHHLTPDLLDAARSSSSAQTSSFATAKEEIASQSDVGSPVDLPLQGARAPKRPGKGGLRNLGWGIESPDVGEESTAHNKVKDGNSAKGATGRDSSTAPWASLPLTRFAMQDTRFEERRPSGITFLEDEVIPSKESPDKASTESSWLESSSVEHLGTTVSKTEARLSPSDSQPTRLSQTSRQSTVVGAAVYDSPPQRARTLRHVSKKKGLRDEASNSPQSNRRSDASIDSPGHRLSHKRGQVLDRQSDVSNASPGLGTTRQQPVPEPTSFLSMDSANKLSARSTSDEQKRSYSWAKPRPMSEPLIWDRLGKADAAKSPGRAHTVAMRSGGTEPESYPKSPFHHLRNSDEKGNPSSSPGSRVSDSRFSPLPNELASHSRSKSTSLNRRGRVFPRELQHLNHGADSEPSAERPSATLSAQRTPQLTSPLSSQCETPEALFVSEATAVSIHPHKNNSVHSVLVIQHPSPSDSSPSRGNDVPSTVAEESANSEPKKNEASTTPPATPPIYEPAIDSVNSPLQHPRSPPLPPTVSIIPPTPSKNGDLTDASGLTHSASRPSRRSSLAKRARRYSDSLGSPFLSFADDKLSRSRRFSTRRRLEIPNEDDERDRSTSEATNTPHHLHPSWQPRLLQESTSLDSNQLINQPVNHPVNASNTAHKRDQGSTPPPIGGTSNMPAPPSGSLRRLLKRNSTSAASAPTSLRSSSRKAGVQSTYSTQASSTITARSNRNSLASLFDFGRTNPSASAQQSRPTTWLFDYEPDCGPRDASPYSSDVRHDRPDQANVTAPLPLGGPPSATTNPARGGSLLRGLSKKLRERSKRREEEHQQEKREKLRSSIGPRIYVEPGDVSGPVSHV
ncbi:MAG: hypothetical protein M1831_005695 [Alyxoria varia]|nr:MAG: hypothetical protein M1831_005695 [Alyxoria varia]